MFSKLSNSARLWANHSVFGLCWAFWIAGCVALHFSLLGWNFDDKLIMIVALYGLGSFLGGFVARLFATAFGDAGNMTKRFSLHFVFLTVFTLMFVVGLFALQHRLYFSQWHEDIFTITWLFQFFFTGLGSIFLFLITGMRPLLPFGILGLIVTSYAFSRGWPARRR